jgi:hypothetical protein
MERKGFRQREFKLKQTSPSGCIDRSDLLGARPHVHVLHAEIKYNRKKKRVMCLGQRFSSNRLHTSENSMDYQCDPSAWSDWYRSRCSLSAHIKRSVLLKGSLLANVDCTIVHLQTGAAHADSRSVDATILLRHHINSTLSMRLKNHYLSVVAVLLCLASSSAHAQGSTPGAFPSLMKPLAPAMASEVQISAAVVPAGLDQEHVVKVTG